MEKKQYDLLYEVLKRFDRAGLLNDMIFIGSWCVYFYQNYFSHISGFKQYTVTTRDIDVLLPEPNRIHSKIDIPTLIQDLGYIVSIDSHTGQMRLDHPELILEFLVPRKGRSLDIPKDIRKLGINAFPLRYMDFFANDTIIVNIQDVEIRIPHPVNFSFQKLLSCSKRIVREKADKDKNTTIQMLQFLIKNGEELKKKGVFTQIALISFFRK